MAMTSNIVNLHGDPSCTMTARDYTSYGIVTNGGGWPGLQHVALSVDGRPAQLLELVDLRLLHPPPNLPIDMAQYYIFSAEQET